MKCPICGICLKSDVLCKACNDKLKSGEVSEAEVRIFRTMRSLSDKLKSLKDINVLKVVESRGLFVIICEEGNASKIIGKNGIVVRKLGRELGKQVRIVEKADDEREFIAELVRPAKVTGVNVLYTPGREVLKVRLDKPAPIPSQDFSQIMKELFNKDVEI